MTQDHHSPGHERSSRGAHVDDDRSAGDDATSRSGHSGSETDSHFDRDHAEHEARDAIGRARNELQALLENQKNAATDQVDAIAQALRRTADELHNKDQITVAAYVGHVADRIAHWSGRLRRRHVDSLAGDIRHFANQQPALFIAGAIVVGFTAARFLNSSSSGQADSTASRQPSDDTAHAAANRTPAPVPGISHS